MKVYEGDILTVDERDSVCRYLVEEDGIIVFTGNDLPEMYRSVPREKVAALAPSFVDTHQHFASYAIFNAGLNVMEASSNKEILMMVKKYVNISKDKLLIAFGASPYSVEERKLVSREELDSVTDDRPFFMVKYDGHACIVNSALLKKIENKVKDLRGFHRDSGEMNQEAFFAVSDYVTNSIPIPKLIKNMQYALDCEAEKGIGMIHTVSGVGFPLNLDISCEQWFAKSCQSGFQLRVFPQSMDTRVAIKRKLPRIGGCFKCALDGCFGSQDAAMIDPYENDSDSSGVLYYSDEEVIEFCKKANRSGLQIEMHAIGDKAFKQATRALKVALDDFPRKNHRHGIIHACLPTKEGLEICMNYGIQLLMQISFDNWKQEPMEYIEELIGEIRAKQLNPIGTYNRNGIKVSLGSDAPCTAPNPIEWIYKAVNHSNPSEAVSVQIALRMCTYNGCWTSFDEKRRGSLEVGKIADMVILSDNPYTVCKEELSKIKIEQLILQGKTYEKQSQGVLKSIVKGIISESAC